MTNENDHELLELAAKAAGYNAMEGYGIIGPPFWVVEGEVWNPLADDGDALRLAVKLRIEIHPDEGAGQTVTAFTVGRYGYNTMEDWGPMRDGSKDDEFAATRRAITRAAAEIGKQLKEKNHA